MPSQGFVHIEISGVGKSTQKSKNTASAKIAYACRGSACFDVVATGSVPADVKSAQSFFNKREKGLRANGRVCEVLELGLPKEALNHAERKKITVSFLKRMGMADYVAAFHKPTKGSPDNHHVHIVGIGQGWNAGGFPKMIREAWCQHLNAWAQVAGKDLYFDHRSLDDQAAAAKVAGDHERAAELEGRKPRHIGPQLRAIVAKKPEAEIRPYVRIRLKEHVEDQALVLEKRRVRGRNRGQSIGPAGPAGRGER